jgi:diguanylate cyclase (GGDEF)-like protein
MGRSINKSIFLSVIGAFWGFGSPLGAMILLWFLPHPTQTIWYFAVEEYQNNSFFFIYMTSATCFFFAFFGYRIGQSEDQILKRDRRLTNQVLIDPLTRLGNHRFLHESFSAEYQRHRVSHQPLSCLMLDLDHFKRVNDTYGHPFGDYVLFHFAKIIQKSIRQGDTATRYGGEEFLCILPNCDLQEAFNVSERIRQKTQNCLFSKENHQTKITVSIGLITSHKISGTSYKRLIDLADKALYQAKMKGRNKIVQINLDQNS